MTTKEQTILTDKYFRDWESYVFGYGYGSGEEPVMKAILQFFNTMTSNSPERPYHKSYDHEVLEKTLGNQVTWLLINNLCHADILEYGTSPRYGWLTEKGQILYRYLENKTLKDVMEVLFGDDAQLEHENDTFGCTKSYCNCDPNKQIMKKCTNPLF